MDEIKPEYNINLKAGSKLGDKFFRGSTKLV